MTVVLVRDVQEHLAALEHFYACLGARQWYGDHVCLAVQPDIVHGSPEDLVDDGMAEGARILGRWADSIVDAIGSRTEPRAIAAAVDGAVASIDVAELAEPLGEFMVRGAMLGALDSNWEHDHEEEIDVVAFRAPQPFVKMPHDEAIRLWEERRVLSPEAFESLEGNLRRRAFTFAGVATDELRNVAHAEIGRQLERGPRLENFQQFARERMESAGWTPSNPSHVETIYRTNVSSAYSSGRFAEMTDPDVMANLPYWQVRGVRDARQRPTHRAAYGIVLPADHEFWLRAYPPFGFSCRCRVIARTRRWVERTGATIGPVPRGLPDPGFDSPAPTIVQVPRSAPAPRRDHPRPPPERPQPRPQRPSPPTPQPPPPRPARPTARPSPSSADPKRVPPKPEPRETIGVHRGRRVVELTPEQQEAERNARWMRLSPAARRAATTEERLSAHQWEWTSGSNRKSAVVLKQAAKEELGLEGDVWSRGIIYRITKAEVNEVRKDVRAMQQKTQAYFKQQGIKRVKLYRGIKPGTGPHRNAVESWTSDPRVARRFAGRYGKVLEADIPAEQILTHHRVPGWVDGPYGGQSEYLVVR